VCDYRSGGMSGAGHMRGRCVGLVVSEGVRERLVMISAGGV